MNLLIVDDIPTDMKLLRAQLEAEGHAVFEAHDGVGALALLERQRVDAVISDILMPRMDGYRLCHEIRKHARLRDLPIILYTSSYTSPSDEKLALDLGADKYLMKPASVETIIAALHEVIAKPHTAPRPQALQEIDVLKEYSGRLVSTLVGKTTELMAAERKFRALVEQSIVGIYIIQDDQFVYVNPRMVEIFGRSEAEMTSRMVSDFIVPEDQALAHENIGKRMSGGVPSVHYALRVLHQSGAVLEVEVHGSRTEYNGRPAVMGTLLDITERKRAEERLRAMAEMLNVAPSSVTVHDFEGKFIYANRRTLEIHGYDEREFMSLNLHELDVPESEALIAERMRLIAEPGGATFESAHFRKDGSIIPLEVSVKTVEWGGAPAILSVATDITERQQANAEKTELEVQFHQAQKMESVGQLASGIAHDFNNLLTVINGMSGLVLEQVGKDDPVHADVQEILHAGQRAAELTRQLLAFSRRQILESRVVSLNTVVTGMESLLRRLLGEDIDLVVVLTPGLDHVKVDPGQIEQVLTNLAVNARDAMPQGGRLTIETRRVTTDKDYARQLGITMPPGSYVLLTVSDAGVGMDAATRTHIFEPFFTTKGPGQGTGLGLSTVYGVVKQSHGFIGVYSEVGLGTSFKIYLPQMTEPADTDRPAPTEVSSAGTETILLAEDNAGLRKLATRILASAGYTVLGAASGEKALLVLERHKEPVQLLLTDVVMPGMSGRYLAELLAQTRPEMKVLYMSGYTSDTILRHGVLEAQVAFLNKPFTAAALLRKVREVLDS